MRSFNFLIIEDEPDIIEAVSLCFELKWPCVNLISASRGKTGVELAEIANPDFIILDLSLPDIDGFEVLRRIRSFSDVPVIIHTARNEESDVVMGLEIGADDYILKPFEPTEFLARIRAVMSRSQTTEIPRIIESLSSRVN